MQKNIKTKMFPSGTTLFLAMKANSRFLNRKTLKNLEKQKPTVCRTKCNIHCKARWGLCDGVGLYGGKLRWKFVVH